MNVRNNWREIVVIATVLLLLISMWFVIYEDRRPPPDEPPPPPPVATSLLDVNAIGAIAGAKFRSATLGANRYESTDARPW